MKKILFLCVSIFCTNLFADPGNRTFKCDAAAFRQNTNSAECNSSRTRREQSLCLARQHKNVAKSACSQIMQSGFRSMGFMFEQLALIDELGDAGTISPAERSRKFSALDKMIDDEQDFTMNQLQSSWDNIDAARNESRLNSSINRAIGLMSGTYSNNTPTTHTYSIDGRLISCTTNGSFTTCN